MKHSFLYFIMVLFFILFVYDFVNKENKIEKQNNEIKTLTKHVRDLRLAITVKDQPYIPDSISFFGGTVPLHYHGVWDDIDYWIRYYTNPKNRWRILSYLEKKEVYFPVIGRILEKEHISLDAQFVSVAESEMDQIVKSKAGAKGFWQFMIATGRRNKLVINGKVDERLHVERATKAASDELKSLQKEFEQFGSFESRMFALAAYNAGSGRVWQAIRKDNERSYFLLMSLPKETEQYIPRIIALKLMLENPERYGFSKGVTFGGPSVRLVEYSAKRFESWEQLAKKFGISKKEIRRANAHMLSGEGISKGDYVLRIPERNK